MKTQDELDDVQQHSGDGGEGLSDFYRSLESRDEGANTREGQAINLSGGQLRKREGDCVAPAGEPNETSAAIAIFPRGDCNSNGPAILQTLNSHTAQNFLNCGLSKELEYAERNRREDEKERIEKEWYENERSRAATADKYDED